MKYFTGIGSRQTPKEFVEIYKDVCKLIDVAQFTLRSGGADGSDLFFENAFLGNKEIYLPWEGFNSNPSQLFDVCEKAKEMTRVIHPLRDKLSGPSLNLHARNVYQVLGKDLNMPSSFLLCWTPNGEVAGGTATAIKLAKKYNIPILNFGSVREHHINAFVLFYERFIAD